MTKYRCTEEIFLKDVSEHEMTICHDDGVYRHLKFYKLETNAMSFDLITGPGYLLYRGDMGCYEFERLPDMFQFFRKNHSRTDGLYINPSYWAEKIEAANSRDGVKEYNPEKFKDAINEYLENDEISDELRADIQENIIDSYADTSEFEARQAVDAYEFESFTFADFWECDLQYFTYRYIWCCYAIAWGIDLYDKHKLENIKSTSTDEDSNKTAQTI